MSAYDFLLDGFVLESNGRLKRDEIDQTITQAANAMAVSKWQALIAFGQALSAYANFEKSVRTLENAAPISESEFSRVNENILQMADTTDIT